VPAGRYTLGVWHERFGKKSEAVAVAAGEEATTAVHYGR
jgi:hypothetical protein